MEIGDNNGISIPKCSYKNKDAPADLSVFKLMSEKLIISTIHSPFLGNILMSTQWMLQISKVSTKQN
jgi:hypothetical protein